MTPNPTAPPAAPKPTRWPIYAAIGGVAFICLCCVPASFVGYLTSLPEAGVLTELELDEESRKHIAAHVSLDDDEEIVCFYDSTLQVNGTEASLLTTKRLVSWKGTRTSEMAVAEIVRVTWRDVPLQGDVITAYDESGRELEVAVAPMNDGKTFVEAMERVTGLSIEGRTKNRPAEPNTRVKPAPVDDAPHDGTRRRRR